MGEILKTSAICFTMTMVGLLLGFFLLKVQGD
nr:cytochrome b6-f complex subunit VII [Fibrocapsa japonica]UTE95189.1 cytochrome b6-f complex subunit VII [Fibrocapsa japonica]